MSTGYNITLFDDGSVVVSASIYNGTNQALLSDTNIRNGYNYEVKIESRSEAFTSSVQYLYSESFSENIRTLVQGENLLYTYFFIFFAN